VYQSYIRWHELGPPPRGDLGGVEISTRTTLMHQVADSARPPKPPAWAGVSEITVARRVRLRVDSGNYGPGAGANTRWGVGRVRLQGRTPCAPGAVGGVVVVIVCPVPAAATDLRLVRAAELTSPKVHTQALHGDYRAHR